MPIYSFFCTFPFIINFFFGFYYVFFKSFLFICKMLKPRIKPIRFTNDFFTALLNQIVHITF